MVEKLGEVTIPLSQQLIDETTTEEMKLLSEKMESEIFNPNSVDWLLKELEEIGVLSIKNCHWSDEVDVKKAIEQAKAKTSRTNEAIRYLLYV